MSRSGYTDDIDDNWLHIMWRGRVASATKGRRGQKMLRDMLAALDAMPVKELIAHRLDCPDGVCALGALGRSREMDMSGLDPEDYQSVSAAFDIAEPLAQEIVYLNDEAAPYRETPAERHARMRSWVAAQLREAAQ